MIRNLFISSKYRLNTNERPSNLSIWFPPDFIDCGEGQVIKVNVVNFHLPNNMYNINDNNNTFKIYVNGEIEKTMIHIDYFPNSINECGELIEEYQI